MSSEPAESSGDAPGQESTEDLLGPLFDDDELTRIENAAGSRSESLEQFIREGVLFLAADTLGDGGHLECWAEDCNRTFATERRRRGHFGSAHEQDRPDDDFWCGICGYGETTYAGVRSHHGQRHPDRELRPLDHEPDADELLDPDDVPDHMDRELLAELYDEHEGNVAAMCRAHDFDVSYGRVSHYLEQFGIHERTPDSPEGTTNGPDHRNPELLEQLYEEHDGVIADVYRAHDFDVGYPKVVQWCKQLGLHDPEDPPGRAHGRGGPDPGSDVTSRESCLAALEKAAERLGHPPSQREYDALDMSPSAGTIARICNSWSEAKKAADLGPDTGSRTVYTRSDCLAAIRDVAEQIGHPPSTGEYGHHREDGHPAYQTIYARFESFPAMRAEALEGTPWEGEADDHAATSSEEDGDEATVEADDHSVHAEEDLDPLDVDDAEDLELAYEATDSIAAATELFPDATYGVVRQHLIDHGIHVPADREVEPEEPELGQPDATEPADEDVEPAPSVDVGSPDKWGFESGFETVDEQQDTGGDRLVEDAHCVRCGDPYEGEGLCDTCAGGLEEELVTDGGEVLACPECDRSDVERRNGKDGRAEPGTYRCKDCGARFDDPVRRPPKKDPGPRPLGSIGRALVEANPDDLGEPITDGGVDVEPETGPCIGCDTEIPVYHDFCSADCAFQWGGGRR